LEKQYNGGGHQVAASAGFIKGKPCFPFAGGSDNERQICQCRPALPAKERKTRRHLSVKPLVETYFTRVRETLPKVPQKSRTWEGFSYSLNQEKHLDDTDRSFLDDLLPWSPSLPANCHKPDKSEVK